MGPGSARRWSLARQLFALQAAVVAIVLAGVTLAAYLQFDEQNRAATAEEMLGIAHTLADSTDVLDALASSSPTATLQPLAERVRVDTATDFVVVMSPGGVRFTHPTPDEIGRVFRGTIAPAARGEPLTETYPGTLGPSVRAVVPVVDGSGRVVALVSVGRTVTAASRDVAAQVPVILGAAAAALMLAAGGSWLVSRWLRRATHDLGPAELSRMYEYYDAVLHAVREGLLLLDGAGRVQLVNDEARRLLRLPDDLLGRRVEEFGPLGAALATGGPRADEIHVTSDRILVVNQRAAVWAGRDLGTVVTLRDHTELRELVSELHAVRGVADSLGAQAHEAANQLHTVIALIELGRAEEALEFATAGLAQDVVDAVLRAIAVPEVAALVVAKAAAAADRGVTLTVDDGSLLPAGTAAPRDLVTIVGNLLDNAIDAAAGSAEPRWVRLGARFADAQVRLRVADSGPGLAPADAERAFVRGWSTKDPHRGDGPGRGLGLALVRQAAHRHGGRVAAAGSEFTVCLPVSAPVGPSGDEARPSGVEARPSGDEARPSGVEAHLP